MFSRTRILLILALLDVTVTRQPDRRWLARPPEHIEAFSGNNVTLSFRYRKPSQLGSPGKIYYSYQDPKSGDESILFEGSIDPDSGNVQFLHNSDPERIRIETESQGFKILLYNLSVTDMGVILTDINFQGEAALTDDIRIDVFDSPRLADPVPPQVSSVTVNTDYTLTWRLDNILTIPEIRTVLVSWQSLGHTESGSGSGSLDQSGDLEFREPVILVRQERQSVATSDSGSGGSQWLVEYSATDSETPLDGHGSYTQSPSLDLIQINLYKLRVIHSGIFGLRVLFKNNIAALRNDVTLLVLPSATSTSQSMTEGTTSTDLSEELTTQYPEIKALDLCDHVKTTKSVAIANLVILILTILAVLASLLVRRYLKQHY